MHKKIPEITENWTIRLMAALAGQEVRDMLEGKGNVELAKKSLQLLLEIIAVAVPNAPSSDIKKVKSALHILQQRKDAICPCCNGDGRLPDINGGTKRCEHCKGLGKLSLVVQALCKIRGCFYG